jgi:hypothetical protein
VGEYSPAEIVAYVLSMLSALGLGMTGGNRSSIEHPEAVDEPAPT